MDHLVDLLDRKKADWESVNNSLCYWGSLLPQSAQPAAAARSWPERQSRTMRPERAALDSARSGGSVGAAANAGCGGCARGGGRAGDEVGPVAAFCAGRLREELGGEDAGDAGGGGKSMGQKSSSQMGAWGTSNLARVYD